VRISADYRDPAYKTTDPKKRYKIFLDGALVPWVITADDELGVVVHITETLDKTWAIVESKGAVKIFSE